MTLTKTVVAAAAATLTFAASAHADVSTSTVSYNVVPGACSASIAVPANNKPVLIMGTQIAVAHQGIGEAALLRATASPALLDWAGTSIGATVLGTEPERGYDTGAGTHIMWIDYAGQVDVQTATSTHVKVCNVSGSTIPNAVGYLTFIY